LNVCYRCGKKLADGAMFCWNCGAAVNPSTDAMNQESESPLKRSDTEVNSPEELFCFKGIVYKSMVIDESIEYWRYVVEYNFPQMDISDWNIDNIHLEVYNLNEQLLKTMEGRIVLHIERTDNHEKFTLDDLWNQPIARLRIQRLIHEKEADDQIVLDIEPKSMMIYQDCLFGPQRAVFKCSNIGYRLFLRTLGGTDYTAFSWFYIICKRINVYCISLDNNSIALSDIHNLSGGQFEVLCQRLLESMSFEVVKTKATRDGGIDLIAINNQSITKGKYIIQCKRYSSHVGEPIIRDLYGVVMSERANKGILLTTGSFTSSAYSFAQDKQIELIDGTQLLLLLQRNGLSRRDSENEERALCSLPLIQNPGYGFRCANLADIFQKKIYASSRRSIPYFVFSEDNYRQYLTLSNSIRHGSDKKDISKLIDSIYGWLFGIIGLTREIESIDEYTAIVTELHSQIHGWLTNCVVGDSVTLYYIYRMLSIQLDLMMGRFTDAKRTFLSLSHEKALQMTREEMVNPNMTKILFFDSGLLYMYCYTCFNMMQQAIITNDQMLSSYIIQNDSIHNIITMVIRNFGEWFDDGDTSFESKIIDLQNCFIAYYDTTKTANLKGIYTFDRTDISIYTKNEIESPKPSAEIIAFTNVNLLSIQMSEPGKIKIGKWTFELQ